MQFIEEQKVLFPDLAEKYDILGDLCSKKLWHELTSELSLFLSDSSNSRGDNFLMLYDGFINSFESRLSQLRLAGLVSIIGNSFNDPGRALTFFERVLSSRNRLGTEASLCIDADVIVVKLRLGMVAEVRRLLDDAKEQLGTLSSSETFVFSKYYKASMEFRKVIGPPEEFYKESLMFMSYTSAANMHEDEKYILATDVAIAAVAGEGVYNFGELIATPVLESLKKSANEWLFNLVMALHQGDIDSFNIIVGTCRNSFDSQPALASRREQIKQKVVLLALMNMVFRRPSHDRTITYQEIAETTRISIEQVDWVLIRAMSIGLIRGSIDEVSQTVNVSWVQPRVLDKEQLYLLRDQLSDWTDRVKNMLVTVEDQTLELYV